MFEFGSTEIGFRGQSGDFYCPDCGDQRRYSAQTVWRFVTLYFVPVFPLGTIDRWIVCDACAGAFTSDVAMMERTELEAARDDDFAVAVYRAMLLLLVADGRPHPAQRRALVEQYLMLTGEELSHGEPEAAAQDAAAADVTVAEFARAIAPKLNAPQREMLIRACFLVGTAGPLGLAQQRQLAQLPGALGVPASEFRTIIDRIVART